jgi:AcrR family transcriptional regulator
VSARPAAHADGTRAALLDAAAGTLRDDGLAGLSARHVAARAGINQALIFYHFGSLLQLVDAACRAAVDASIHNYREQSAAAGTFGDLLTVGRELHQRERAAGNVAMMAQLMSGAQRNEQLATTARYCLARWNDELEAVVTRLLERSALAGLLDPAGLTRVITSGFLGLELYEGVDAAAAQHALNALERLGDLVEIVDELPPIARRALRTKMRRRSMPQRRVR